MPQPLPATPDVVAPPPGHPRFPLIDSLRAIAAIAIVMVHVALLSGPLLVDHWWRGLLANLNIGVTLFFLLSGFLLYRPFVAARELGSPPTPVATYARRRFLRIAPAYWLALTALTIFPGVYGAFTGNWWIYYGLLQNYPIYTATGGCAENVLRCGLSPTWSLGVEVGFYICLPIFALGMAWLTTRARRSVWFFVEISVLLLISVISVGIQGHDGTSDLFKWLYFSPVGRGWWFALGMALAVLSVHTHERGAEAKPLRWLADNPLVCWGAAIGLYVFCALFLLPPEATFSGRTTYRAQFLSEFVLFGVISALMIIPAVFGEDRGGLPRRILANPVLGWLGLISYGIFLWHFPIMLGLVDGGILDWWPSHAFIVTTITTLAITIVCASISYYALERPLMRFKNKRKPKPRPLVSSGTGPQKAGST